MLATDLARVASAEGYQVTGTSHGEMDVTQAGQVRQVLEGTKPQVVVNTPGIGVDTCEERPEEGYLMHTWAAGVVARECQRIDAVFVYISTCGLFGDEMRFYSEYDPVVLKTQYARSKLLGEQEAFRACERTFVIRPGWMYGGTQNHQRNFVFQRYQEALREPMLKSAGDKYGSPTFTGDVAAKLLEILEMDEYGLYHVTNQGSASRYDYVKYIVNSFGLDTPVEKVDSSSFPRRAPVPDCETLENLNVRFLGLQPMEPWQDAIDRYVHSIKANIGQ